MVSTVIGVVLYLWGFWVMYVVCMGIYRAHLDKRLKGLNFLLSLPVVVLGIFLDVVSNITLATIIFLDVPREWLVTHRLKKYVGYGEGWRYLLAKWICDHLLDIFDPTGNHC